MNMSSKTMKQRRNKIISCNKERYTVMSRNIESSKIMLCNKERNTIM